MNCPRHTGQRVQTPKDFDELVIESEPLISGGDDRDEQRDVCRLASSSLTAEYSGAAGVPSSVALNGRTKTVFILYYLQCYY